MNISYNWIKDYLKFDLSPRETAEALTSIGIETEGIEETHSVKGGLEGFDYWRSTDMYSSSQFQPFTSQQP